MTSSTSNNVTTTLRVCVGNYGYYNEGELRDTWADLPMDPNQITPWLTAHGLYDAAHEETYISDVDNWPFEVFGLDLVDLRSCNRIAIAMEYAGPDGVEAVANALECSCDAPGSVDGLINLLLQADEIPYAEFPRDQWGYPSKELFGYEYADETGLLAKLQDMNADCYFDFEKYGRDLLMDYMTSDDGYLYDEMPADDFYSADEIDELLGLKPESMAA